MAQAYIYFNFFPLVHSLLLSNKKMANHALRLALQTPIKQGTGLLRLQLQALQEPPRQFLSPILMSELLQLRDLASHGYLSYLPKEIMMSVS